jgi:predicted acylesterase/phospholipase RssA
MRSGAVVPFEGRSTMSQVVSRRHCGRLGFRALFAAVLLPQIPLAGCAIPERSAAVPESQTLHAAIPGMPIDIRYFVDKDADLFLKEAIESVKRERAYRADTGQTGPLPPAAFLAISGGSDNGAFAAGLLNGWTAAGNRPEFKGVTGVSTGALIAPLAFLGSDYDQTLRKSYTTISKKDIFEERGITAAFFDDAMADSAPLSRLVAGIITPELLARIADEYKKGRLLLVGTTDLDARRPVIWNMTAIAAVGGTAGLDLFRKVLVASASIPGAFPPVMIDVEIAGKRYEEMHVDGGAMAQVFLYPPLLSLSDLTEATAAQRTRTLYLIRNARLDPEWASVERRTLGILARAIGSLVDTQGIGDLYRIYLITERDKVDYNLAFIPTEFDRLHEESFDTGYMRSLFDYAFEKARRGYPWSKYPPGYSPVGARATQG